jgi:hypothetical protein
LYQDWLHPNKKWYENILDSLLPYIYKFCNE